MTIIEKLRLGDVIQAENAQRVAEFLQQRKENEQ